MQKLSSVILGAATALFAASGANAIVVYQTGFEAPTYAVGNLTGQNSWAQFGSARVSVQTGIVKTGAQAAKVDGSGYCCQSGPFRASPTALPQVSLSADIYLASGSAQRAWQFSAIGAGLVGFSGGIDVNPNGDVLAITGAFPVIAAGAFTRDVWHNVDIRLDYAAQRYSIRLDNVTLASGLTFCASNGACTGNFIPSYDTMIFDTFGGNGNDAGYIDNIVVQSYSIGTVPEPASWALMIAGFGMVGSQLRRRSPVTTA